MTSTFRDPSATPTPYRGIQMRSGLEVTVAQTLDQLGVDWLYEAPAPVAGYIPDFTIVAARPDMQLTRWLEVKPADLLYEVRNIFGLPELLDGSPITVYATVDRMHELHIQEIHKPQRLAAATGEDVLVVSALNRTSTLSITCHGDRLTFSKWHPAVNWRAVEKRRREAAERARYRAESAARQASWDREQAARAAERLKRLRYLISNHKQIMPAKFPSACHGCLASKDAGDLVLYRPADEWVPICLRCVETHRGARP